jgi:hypothetical protein
MNLNQSNGIDVYLIKSFSSCDSSFVLSVITDSKCISDRDDVFVDLTYFISEFSFTKVCASKHLKVLEFVYV